MRIDPALATRLAAVLKKVAHGKTLVVAAAEAGIGATEIERIVKELDRELWALAREAPEEARGELLTHATAPEPPKPARKKPPARGTRRSAVLSLVAYADGGSRGNPGEAACAAVVTDADGAELLRRSKRLGKTTNNVAEYEGVLLALDLCRQLGAATVRLRLDSELVVRQINGRYRVKHPGLSRLFLRVREESRAFAKVVVEHVPRQENKVADELVNATLDDRDTD
jgi:ribonuclease HI